MAHRPRAEGRHRQARQAVRSDDGDAALKLHTLEVGEGRPLIWLHGFPDHPPTAIDFFEKLGRRVIAPWLRGYAPSPSKGRQATIAGPLDVEAHARDVIELIDRIGAPIDLVGHDWGAAITYTVCAIAPDKVRRAVTLACPHPRTLLRMVRKPAQLRKSWYMVFFQLPLSARIAAANDFALIDRLWRAWSPGFTLDDTRRRDLHACLAASWPAPIRFYRPQRFRGGRIETPLLQLHGANDGCIEPPTENDAHRFADRTLAVLPGLGHFIHLEDPAGIAARIAAWLA